MAADGEFMKVALRLARRGLGHTSPNPMVGAVLVKGRRIIGQGWHRRAGLPHAEIEALADAASKKRDVRGAVLYVTLEPCCTTGRTPPCTEAIIRAGVAKVVAGATDPNPSHCGRGFQLLRDAGLEVISGVLTDECAELNEAFNHWIARRTPFVTVKAAMTLDGKIATASGESKWITSEKSRQFAMRLRRQADCIVAGVSTIIADDPALTVRGVPVARQPLRVVMDPRGRTPLDARVASDAEAFRTVVFVSERAPERNLRELEKRVEVVRAPSRKGGLDIGWVLRWLGKRNVVSALIEGGGETNASFLLSGHAQRVAFFYAPKILGGRESIRGVGGEGARAMVEAVRLRSVRTRRIGPDLVIQARIDE
jgi:diaminohydroxyphosphoribosylaminopyrimidine deaminase/5-amino-6-(5-phosphoribosylamino)uracil reductase